MAGSIMRIEGIHPTIDGDYPFSIGDFTNRDWSDVKRIAKVRVMELKEAFEKGDTDLFVAFAAIALRHAGKSVMEDMLWDAPSGKLTLVDGEEEEVDDLPPALASPSGAQSEPGGGGNPSDSNEISGLASRNGSDSQESDPSRIGRLPSAIGATSPSAMSAS